MVQNEETQYIARILNGDTEAFSVFLDRYSRPLYVLIVQIVGCPEDAEELVQDVFLKAFRCLDSYKNRKSNCELYTKRFVSFLQLITQNDLYI
ncbi:RNA polymerase sigma factor [Bacteroides fragilis]|uniref:RNA polymerase sigma factor n=1 Tax=Bacteroides fragilis TaxID=817 RepID=UPI00254644A2|nr:sigma factor [Bacteroides fragilis]